MEKAFIIDRKKIAQEKQEKKETPKKIEKNKTTEVLKHLKVRGYITAREAYELYGSQKVSSIIFNLRRKGYNIITEDCMGKDRYGHSCQFAKYILQEDSK